MMDEDRSPLITNTGDSHSNYGSANGLITPVESDDERHPFPGKSQIQEKAVNIKVYKRRWYILVVFGLMSMTQCAVWNTFSPIAEVGEHVFGWDTAVLSLLTNWGPIAYLVGTLAFSWLVDEKGLRPACILSGFLVAVGTGLRCITSKTSVATPLIHVGQFLNGLAGPIAMGGPPAVSAEWFPPEQRTTATAIATIFNTLGLAVSFLLGPYLVPLVKLDHSNSTPHHNTSLLLEADGMHFDVYIGNHSHNGTSNTTDTEYDIDAERHSLMMYMYYSFGWSAFCFLLFFTYFPSKPPSPPSTSASLQRLEFKVGLKKLMTNRTFWLICFTYGLPLGVMSCWQGVLDVNLKDHNISQDTAAWLGFWGVIATCASAFIAARGADIYAKHMKLFLIGLFALGGTCFTIFALALVNIVPDSSAVLYSSYILGSTFIGATSPLFFEMACEVTYPIAEGITNLVLTLVNNIAGMLFLIVQLFPNIGTMWENWCLVGTLFIIIPVFFLLRERYNRLDIDILVDEDDETNKQ